MIAIHEGDEAAGPALSLSLAVGGLLVCNRNAGDSLFPDGKVVGMAMLRMPAARYDMMFPSFESKREESDGEESRQKERSDFPDSTDSFTHVSPLEDSALLPLFHCDAADTSDVTRDLWQRKEVKLCFPLF